MRFLLSLPTDEVDHVGEFLTGDAIGEMASAAERAGFAAVCATEHPFPGDEWLAGADGHHPLDPFVALAFAAAATSTIRLMTYLCVLPYRNPFLTAKAALSLHVASHERFVLGAGTGYVASEFRALGVDFADRNARCDEAIVAIRRAWSEDGVTMRGLGFDASGNTMLPHPGTAPPILVGGNSKRALRRAVDLGDGWIPMRHSRRRTSDRRSAHLDTIDDLREMLAYAAEYRGDRPGWSGGVLTMPLVAASPDARTYDRRRLLDHLQELGDLGVDGVVIGLRGADRAAVVRQIEQLGAEVITDGALQG